MATQSWYDRPIPAMYGVSAKDAAVATGLVVGVPVAAGLALRPIERAMSAPAARAKGPRQVAPRYRDNKLAPRTLARALKPAASQFPQIPGLQQQAKRMSAAAKGTATKVANGTIQPFQARRAVGGQFATRGQKIASQVGAALPKVGKALGIASVATTAASLGLVAYNLATGKHAGDREEAMQRPNDPGRLATSGLVGYATTGIAARTVAGIAATTVGGVIARATPIGLGALASYGAYKGYADDGVRGAARGAANALTFGLAGPAFDKAFGKKDDSAFGAFMRGVGTSGSKAARSFMRGSDAGETAAPRQKAASAAHAPVTSYQRTYTKGPKAGLTETVNLA